MAGRFIMQSASYHFGMSTEELLKIKYFSEFKTPLIPRHSITFCITQKENKGN